MGCESDLQALANFLVPQQHLGWNITSGAHYQTPNGTKNLFILHCLYFCLVLEALTFFSNSYFVFTVVAFRSRLSADLTRFHYVIRFNFL